jgi:hypothetical protein
MPQLWASDDDSAIMASIVEDVGVGSLGVSTKVLNEVAIVLHIYKLPVLFSFVFFNGLKHRLIDLHR